MNKTNLTRLIQNKQIKMQPLPAQYIGVWQRELLETQTIKDTTSLVLWMQSQHYHIDLRIPRAVQTGLRKVESLQDYNDDELLLLASQQGFAGITNVTLANNQSSDICQWLREIDFQPKTSARDMGKMVFTDENTVVETGIDTAYLEVWRRLTSSQEAYLSTFAIGQDRNGLTSEAYLICSGKYVAFARPRVTQLPISASLISALDLYKPTREQLLDWLDMEISFGEMLDDKHWRITYSSLPFKVGLVMDINKNIS